MNLQLTKDHRRLAYAGKNGSGHAATTALLLIGHPDGWHLAAEATTTTSGSADSVTDTAPA